MQSMKYSVVIPTYNHCEKYLKPCIDSIIKYTDMTNVELVVSANGCVDNTREYLAYLGTLIPNLIVVWNDAPLGYSKATNEGIKVATADKIILLNNDTVLLEQAPNQWIDMLDNPFYINEKCGITCVIRGFSEPANHYFAIFFCVMIHRKVFDAIGLLNEDYGVGGGEDTEFSIEAEEAGFEVCEVCEKHWATQFYAGAYPIYHKGEGTVHDTNLVQGWDVIFQDNSLRLAKKYNLDWYYANIDDGIKKSLQWLCNNGTEASELYDEVIRGNIYDINSRNLKDRDVIDIGANMGTFSIFASKLGASKVIAVEPVSSTIRVFKANMQTADVSNIILKQNVASNVSGEFVHMSLLEKSGHNSVYKQSDNDTYEQIETITLTELLALTDSNDIFMKMDCEGGEYDVLMNADPEEMKRITTIAIEIHGDMHPIYKGVELIQDKLFEFGYRMIDHKQIGCWDGIDENGNRINYRDIPFTQEIWSR